MKKGTLIGLLLSIALIILLGLLAFYLFVTFRSEAFFKNSERIESEAEAALQALYETQTEVKETEKLLQKDTAPIIWAGDSRILGMKNALADPEEDIFIGASGEGYIWFSETGLPQLDAAIKSQKQAPVVINFGVNDYDNLSRYLSLYTELTVKYPDTDFYFLSVNPIEPTLCQSITNEEIADFNQRLKEAFPDNYLDSFTMLMIDQVTTVDGIHYSEEDYQKIYDFVRDQIF